MSLGGRGLISVLSNVRPTETLDMVKSCLRGDYARAGRLQTELMPLIDALFCEVNPIPVKQALRIIGLDAGDPRLPLTPLSAPNHALLEQLLA